MRGGFPVSGLATTKRLGTLAAIALLAVSTGLAGCAKKRPQTASQTRDKHPPVIKPAKPKPQEVGVYKIGYPYQINGRWYRPHVDQGYNRVGVASWYGDEFANRPTANGENFDPRLMTAAHKTLPLPSVVEVTNLENQKKVRVRVNDRGPFAHNRIIDMSRAAARELGFLRNGTARVRVRILPGESRQVALEAQRKHPTAARRTIWAAKKRGAYPGRTVATDNKRPRQTASSGSSNARGTYFIQAGAFSERANAESLKDELGGKARVVEANVRGQTYYRVQVGPAKSEAEASAVLSEMIDKGHASAHLVRE